MLYLITGGNGAGKTLNGLKWCKELADQSGRPVAYNGRFDLVQDGPLKNWKKIDAKDWQAEPDGTIFFFDECHNDFPLRGNSGAPPQYVAMLAEHRRRGFDFFLITQHPQNIDVFVRRLIQAPGYHRHLKRMAGASSLVSVLEWAAVNPNCEKPGSGESGQVTTVTYPKEVYTWYRSAMLHTGKVKIPKAVYLVAVAAVLVPTMGYFAFQKVMEPKAIAQKVGVAKAEADPLTRPPGAVAGNGTASAGPRTVGQFVAAYVPRIQGLPQTAPIYDDLTKPQQAPYPAACIERKGKTNDCSCFTQQGTRLQTPLDVCRQIVAHGFFMDWHSPQAATAGAATTAAAQAVGAQQQSESSQVFIAHDTTRNPEGRIGNHAAPTPVQSAFVPPVPPNAIRANAQREAAAAR